MKLLAYVMLLVTSVVAVPSVDMGYAPYSRASRHGIQGADAISAVSLSVTFGRPFLGSSAKPGHPGEAMIDLSPNPTTFFLKNGDLYVYVNQSSVLHVNVMDKWEDNAETSTTEGAEAQVRLGSHQEHTHELPHRDGLMKVRLGTKKEGVQGMFYYVLDSLHFGQREGTSKKGGRYLSNGGLWWACEDLQTWDGRGGKSLYMNYGHSSHQGRHRPAGCEGFTLHSFGEVD